jgi:hypothetical protein
LARVQCQSDPRLPYFSVENLITAMPRRAGVYLGGIIFHWNTVMDFPFIADFLLLQNR